MKVVELLLEKGADVNGKDDEGKTMLELVPERSTELRKLLQRYGGQTGH